MKALLLIAAAVLALAAMPSRAGDVEEAARVALAQKRYAEVVALYRGAALTSLGATARYRLAISHQGLEQSSEAWAQLRAALSLDPSGSFASSPARLTALTNAIKAGCSAKGRPGCEAPPAMALPVQPADEVVAKPQAVELANVPDAAPPAAALLQPAQPAGNAEPKADWLRDDVPLVAAALNVAVLLLLSWLVWRSLARDKALPGGARGIQRVRDDVAQLLRQLEATPFGTRTDLHHILSGLLPLLEREAGRVAFRAKGSLATLIGPDRDSAELSARLSAAPLDALHSDARSVEALFRREVI